MTLANKTDLVALVVDDESDIWEVLSDFLKSRGYLVFTASDGVEALAVLNQQKNISVIFSDVRMPKMDGLKLFNEIKALNMNLSFIMMTGHSDMMDMESAYKIGVSEFLTKPFSIDDLNGSLDLVEHAQRGMSSSSVATHDFDYCQLSIDEFISGSKSPSDIFLKLGDDKYLRIARKDGALSLDRIHNYKKKGLQYFYVTKEDFGNYVGMNIAVSKAITKLNIPRHRKLQVLKHSLEVLVRDTYINGMDKAKFQDAKGLVEATLNLAFGQNDLFNLLEFLKKSSDGAYAHSLAVSMYATIVCRHWGWRSATTMNKVAMAGLFHDIGKKELPSSVIAKARIDMTSDEIRAYETHPTRGAALLSQIAGVPEEAVAVALQHHENMAGTGFPHSLNRMRIHPLAKIIGTVNRFVEMAMGDGAVKEPAAVLAQIHTLMREEVDLSTLKALMEIFGVPVPKDMQGLTSPSTDLK